MNIGQRIKERRKALKMSAEEMGEKLGKDRSTIYRYENGFIENLPLDILEPIAEVLQTTPQYLMGWQETEQKNSALVDITIRARTDKEFFSIVNGLNQLNADQLASVKQIVELLLKG